MERSVRPRASRLLGETDKGGCAHPSSQHDELW